MSDRIEFSSLRRLSGMYRAAHLKPIPGIETKEVGWVCKHSHPTREEAVACAERHMLVDIFGVDR